MKYVRAIFLSVFLIAGPATVTVVSTPSVAAADDGGNWFRRLYESWRRRYEAQRAASSARSVPEMSPDVAGSAGALLVGGVLLVASARRRRSGDTPV